MLDLKKQEKSETGSSLKKTVSVFVKGNFVLLGGNWEWDLASDAVFCSDVILSVPRAFEGTKGIIHPDDLSLLEEIITKQKNIEQFNFRLITTYGEVKKLSGKKISVEEIPIDTEVLETGILQKATIELQEQKEYENLQLVKEIYERTERFTGTGIWYYNTSTNETWYSAYVFRIFNLPPQSLNAHLHTFTPFIHPDDKQQVVEFTTKAYKQKAPLYIQYRVKTSAGEKIVSSSTNWLFNTKGEEILSGTLQDMTEQKKWEQGIEDAGHLTGFLKQQLLFDEQHANIGHWQVYLLTRKTSYSDTYYRIFGLKPQSIPAGINGFINYVHPEDRGLFAAGHKKMIYEHSLPEMDFRIIRGDGKLRYVTQRAKLLTQGNEMVVAGIIEDVTVQRTLEKKVSELTENEALKNFTNRGAEEMAGIGTWIWEISTGKVRWSDSFYKLLGYKPNTVELSQKLLMAFIHPEDQKVFKDHQKIVLEEKQETEFEFRLIQRGHLRQMKASFRILENNGISFFIATIQDITKEFLLQQQLRQRVQLAEALSENMLDRVIITDISNNILAWNKECERIYETPKEDAIGANFFDVFPHLKTEEDLNLFNRVLKGEKITEQNKKSAKGRGYYNLHMLPLWDEKQTEVNGIIHIIHDVSKEIELQQNLNDRLNFISSLLESSVDRIIALDRNMNYLYWNKTAEEYYGLKKEEVVGRNILEIFPGFINDPSFSEFRKALGGETVHLPPARQLDGQKNYFETYLIPIKDENNQVSNILWMTHDLLKDYELQMYHAKEHEVLEALNENYIELDNEYRVKYINQNGLEFFKKEKHELEGKLIFDVIPKLADTAISLAMKKAMEEGASTRDEFIAPTTGAWTYISIAPTSEGIVIVFFDIQEMKEAQQKIEESKNVLQAIFNASLHGLIFFKSIRDEKGEIVDFEIAMHNEVTRKWNGRSIVGEHYLELFPAVKETGILEDFKNVVESGEPLHRELYFEGQNFKNWYCVSAVKLGDGLVSTAEDITERKKAEEESCLLHQELVLQNKVYEHAEDIANLGTWTWNPDTNEARYSDKMFVLFGLQPQEVEPSFLNIPQFIHPDDRDRMLQSAVDLKEGREPVNSEYRVIRKDGQERVFRNKARLVRKESGERIFVGTTQDITEETELRKQLVAQADYASTIIDASINRVMAFDTEMTIIAWNKRSEETTGIKREAALGKKVFALFPKLAEDDVIRKAYEKSIGGEYVHLEPKQAIYSRHVYERFFIPLRKPDGRTYAVVLILHDVSELVQKEKELKELNRTLEEKNKELEQKNDEITTFAFVASHDLKEPLRKIHTFSDWLLEEEAGNIGERGKEYLKRMKASVHRLAVLIEDVLTLTKVHTDLTKTENVNLNDIFKWVREEFAATIIKKKAVIKADKLPVIRGNKNQLISLFRNLIDNALKFQRGDQAPRISITSEIVEADHQDKTPLKKGTEYLKLSFCDNGIGFDNRYKTKIFKVFQQLKEIPHEGTGMGLAICKKVMDNHDGIITATSEPGKGSVFCCYFPA